MFREKMNDGGIWRDLGDHPQCDVVDEHRAHFHLMVAQRAAEVGAKKKKLDDEQKCKVEKEENTTPAPPLWIFPSLSPPISLSLLNTQKEKRTPPLYFSKVPVLFFFFYSADPLVNLPIIQKSGMWVLIASCQRGRHIIKNKTSTIICRRSRLYISTHPVALFFFFFLFSFGFPIFLVGGEE